MSEIEIIFESPFMEQDRLILRGENTEACREQFYLWWKAYGKNEEEANDTVISFKIRQEIEDD